MVCLTTWANCEQLVWFPRMTAARSWKNINLLEYIFFHFEILKYPFTFWNDEIFFPSPGKVLQRLSPTGHLPPRPQRRRASPRIFWILEYLHHSLNIWYLGLRIFVWYGGYGVSPVTWWHSFCRSCQGSGWGFPPPGTSPAGSSVLSRTSADLRGWARWNIYQYLVSQISSLPREKYFNPFPAHCHLRSSSGWTK